MSTKTPLHEGYQPSKKTADKLEKHGYQPDKSRPKDGYQPEKGQTTTPKPPPKEE
jgi:hypothetical protein